MTSCDCTVNGIIQRLSNPTVNCFMQQTVSLHVSLKLFEVSPSNLTLQLRLPLKPQQNVGLCNVSVIPGHSYLHFLGAHRPVL